MTQFLPPNLLALFAPRDPLPYVPPVDKLPHEKNSVPYSGIAAFVGAFEVRIMSTIDICISVKFPANVGSYENKPLQTPGQEEGKRGQDTYAGTNVTKLPEQTSYMNSWDRRRSGTESWHARTRRLESRDLTPTGRRQTMAEDDVGRLTTMDGVCRL